MMGWFKRKGRTRTGLDMGRRTDRWWPMLEVLEDRRLLASFGVNSTADRSDASPGNGSCQTLVPGECTLRAAIQEANAYTSDQSDTISFSISGSINLGSVLPNVTGNLNIGTGTTPGSLTVQRSSGGDYRIFTINSGVAATIKGVTVSLGRSPLGGGIHNAGTLTLEHTIVAENTALPAINPDFDCEDPPCSVWDWASLGGGIYNADGAILNIRNGTEITQNNVVGDKDTASGPLVSFAGGGIYNAGEATLDILGSLSDDIEITENYLCENVNDCEPDTVLVGQQSYQGAGIFHKSGIASIKYVTISGNEVRATNVVNIPDDPCDEPDEPLEDPCDRPGVGAAAGGIKFDGPEGLLEIDSSTIAENRVLMTAGTGLIGGPRETVGAGIATGSGIASVPDPDVIIVNSTIAYNVIDNEVEHVGARPMGAGIWAKYSNMWILWSTIAFNDINTEYSPTDAENWGGGGVFIEGNDTNFTYTVFHSTVVAENRIVKDGTPTDNGRDVHDVEGRVDEWSSYNFIGLRDTYLNGDFNHFENNEEGNQVGEGTPILPGFYDPPSSSDFLENYGGPTETIRPALGSALIDNGLDNEDLDVDQRGEDRPYPGSDIGAFECQNSTDCPSNPPLPGGGRPLVVVAANAVKFSRLHDSTTGDRYHNVGKQSPSLDSRGARYDITVDTGMSLPGPTSRVAHVTIAKRMDVLDVPGLGLEVLRI